jgi:hypothetical protein
LSAGDEGLRLGGVRRIFPVMDGKGLQAADRPAGAPVSAVAWKAGWVAVFLAVLFLGATFRLKDLGRFGYWTDEYFHVEAAESLLSRGDLYVPTVGQYTRAKPITYLTAASFKILGESEAAARLPFALINLVFIVVSTWAVLRLFSPGVALVYAVIISLAPICIEMSRECRMYTVFQLAYIGMTFSFLEGFEPSRPRPVSGGRGPVVALERFFGVRAAPLMLAVVCLAVAITVHQFTLHFAVALLAYAAIMIFVTAGQGGWAHAVRSKYGVLLMALVAGLAGMAVFARPFLLAAFHKAISVPSWAPSGRGHSQFYRHFLMDSYPALFFVYPLGAVLLVRRWGRRGLFAVLSFAPLFLLHSFVFGRKDARYMFYIFPFFAIGAAQAMVFLATAAVRSLQDIFRPLPRAAMTVAFLAVVPLVVAAGYPWMSNARTVTDTSLYADWKILPEALRSRIRDGVTFTTVPRDYYHYFGEMPEYYMVDEYHARYRYEPGLVTSVHEAEALLDGHPGMYLVTDAWHLYDKAFFGDEAPRLLARMRQVAHAGDRRLLIYQSVPDVKGEK